MQHMFPDQLGQGFRLLCPLGRLKQFSAAYSQGQVKVRSRKVKFFYFLSSSETLFPSTTAVRPTGTVGRSAARPREPGTVGTMSWPAGAVPRRPRHAGRSLASCL